MCAKTIFYIFLLSDLAPLVILLSSAVSTKLEINFYDFPISRKSEAQTDGQTYGMLKGCGP